MALKEKRMRDSSSKIMPRFTENILREWNEGIFIFFAPSQVFFQAVVRGV